MIASLLAGSRLDRVLRLLDRERKVLLHGPLSELAGLVARREALMAEIAASDARPATPMLEAIREKAERNARLIAAALAGVRSAAAEVARIDAAAGRLRTYAADGSPVEVGRGRVTRDSRA